MSELIAWYLVELRCRLAPDLPVAQVETIVKEAESHLKESAATFVADMQLGEEQAAAAAIEAFGKPGSVAEKHLQQFGWRPFGIKPGWLVWGSGVISLLTWVMEFQWNRGYFDNFGETWQNGVAGFIALIALAIFGIGCYAGRMRYRWTILAIGLAVEFAVFFGFSFLIVGSTKGHQGLSRLHLGRDVSNVNRNLIRLNRLEVYVRDGARVFAAAKSASDIPQRFRDPSFANKELDLYDLPEQLMGRLTASSLSNLDPNGKLYLTPNKFVFAMVDGRVYGLSAVDEFSHAVLAWRRGEAKALTSIAQEEVNMNRLLASATEARSGRLFFFNRDVYLNAMLIMPLFLPVLLFIE